jgi:hypothetical protein
MTTIPAKRIVDVIPGVLPPGGRALDLVGLLLTPNPRVPANTIETFALDTDVESYFGPGSDEAAIAPIYFNGYDNSSQKPAFLKVVQYNVTQVGAWLRGGTLPLTLTQLKNLTGSLTVTVDGAVFSNASFGFSGATSFTSGAAIIATALNAAVPAAASFTGTIAAGTPAVVVGTIDGNILTVNSVTSGAIVRGGIISGTGVSAGTAIQNQLTGTPGGIGTYAVSIVQHVASTTITQTWGLLTVTAVSANTLSIGQTVTGGSTSAGTLITDLITGQGLLGTYVVNKTQTATPTGTSATAVTCTWDAVSSAYQISSGSTGPASTIGFATGTLSSQLMLTSATGAVASQGADAPAQQHFMDSVTALDQDWASFFTLYDPDTTSGGYTQKLAFAAWVNNTEDNFVYIATDHDLSPTVSNPALASFGYQLVQGDYSGTVPLFQPAGALPDKAAFLSGSIASVDFQKRNGRVTFKFRQQTGIVADVTTDTAYTNLVGNGYSAYCVFATANQLFNGLYDGGISGPFKWIDSYVNQIWLNNQLQLSMMILLTNVGSIPYNAAGYTMVEMAAMDPINQALLFGAIRPGVTLSQFQVSEVNSDAGRKIDDVLSTRGWYFLVEDAEPQVRLARESPPCYLWYMDGQSIQKLKINSINVQ